MKLDFRKLSGRLVKVAIVDSGIEPQHPRIGQLAGGVELSFTREGRVVWSEQLRDRAGHGTACAGIVRRKAPEAALYSVGIFDESLTTEGRALIAALNWTIANRMDVVNLSLGLTDPTLREELRRICRQAVERGIVLVAAAHNEGKESYPAAFPEVIGVAGGRLSGLYAYQYRPGAAVECVARGDLQRVCWLGGREIAMAGTSFAASHVTGIVALIRQAYPEASLEQVREILQANAIEIQAGNAAKGGTVPVEISLSALAREHKYSWIRKAALYPFNKEMHALVRGRDLLDFAIVGIADPVGKGLVGRDAGEAIGIAPAGMRIQARLDAALEGADTLILGYVDELSRMRGQDVLRSSIQKALDRGLNVFSLLSVSQEVYSDLHEQARRQGLRLEYPVLSTAELQEAIERSRVESMVDVPVLGVFGTSAQQGKFTLQLALRRRLLAMGYQLGQIGTEHHAELFGMDLAFPMGYASPLNLPLQLYVPYLDGRLKEICHRRRPDLILVGSQSGTIPYDLQESSTHAMASLAFLLGTKPDACVLVVNSIDPEAYIQDTIDALRAVGKTRTLLLAMSDREKQVQTLHGRTWIKPRPMAWAEIESRLKALEERFKLPAICIADEQGVERMVRQVVAYFAEGKEEDSS